MKKGEYSESNIQQYLDVFPYEKWEIEYKFSL